MKTVFFSGFGRNASCIRLKQQKNTHSFRCGPQYCADTVRCTGWQKLLSGFVIALKLDFRLQKAVSNERMATQSLQRPNA
jgi:hypothetical protein